MRIHRTKMKCTEVPADCSAGGVGTPTRKSDASVTRVDNQRGDDSSPMAQAGADFVGERIAWPKMNDTRKWVEFDELAESALKRALKGPVEKRISDFPRILHSV